MVFVKLGMLSYETMSKTRSYAIVGIFVAAAVLTPTPDIFTLLLMALPMIILYEMCIWLAYFDRKKNRIREEQEARESMERQLVREERLRAAAAAEAEEYPMKDDHADESSDDSWHAEYPQYDPHASDELPELDPEPPDDAPRKDP